MPRRETEATGKTKQKEGIFSRLCNIFFTGLIGFMYYFMLFSFIVLMPLFFVCVAILVAPKLWFGTLSVYGSIVSSIGLSGLVAAVLGFVGLLFGLRGLWLRRGVHAKHGKLNRATTRCFIGRHDYDVVDGYETQEGGYIYHTCVWECRHCSSQRSETVNDRSNYY